MNAASGHGGADGRAADSADDRAARASATHRISEQGAQAATDDGAQDFVALLLLLTSRICLCERHNRRQSGHG
jgi:hypothetical protein